MVFNKNLDENRPLSTPPPIYLVGGIRVLVGGVRAVQLIFVIAIPNTAISLI